MEIIKHIARRLYQKICESWVIENNLLLWFRARTFGGMPGNKLMRALVVAVLDGE